MPIKLEGLEENIVPVTAEPIHINCKLPSGSSQTISRTQVPVLINFSMTDYASQGRSRTYNVVDLQECRTHQSVYTCLSRGTSYNNTLIIRDFSEKNMVGGISGWLRQEFRELELLDEITHLRYCNILPSGVGGSTRNQLISSYRHFKGVDYMPKTMPAPLAWSTFRPYNIESTYDEPEWEIIEKHKLSIQNSLSIQDKGSDEDIKMAEIDQSSPKRDTLQSSEVILLPAKGSIALNDTSIVKAKRIFRKRKRSNDNLEDLKSEVKKLKVNTSNIVTVEPVGFIWNSIIYSCAFDSLFTILYNIMIADLQRWSNLTISSNQYMSLFTSTFQHTTTNINEGRDQIQSMMAELHPTVFHTTDLIGNDIQELCEYMLTPTCTHIESDLTCSHCKVTISNHVPSHILSWNISVVEWERKTRRAGSHVGQFISTWMKALMNKKSLVKCVHCGHFLNKMYHFISPIPFLIINLDASIMVQLQRSMQIDSYQYNLRGIIYFGQNHFTSRFIAENGDIWYHDGIETGSLCIKEGNMDTISLDILTQARNRKYSIAIYVHHI